MRKNKFNLGQKVSIKSEPTVTGEIFNIKFSPVNGEVQYSLKHFPRVYDESELTAYEESPEEQIILNVAPNANVVSISMDELDKFGEDEEKSMEEYLDEASENDTPEFDAGDRVIIESGEHQGKRGVVIYKIESLSGYREEYLIYDKSGVDNKLIKVLPCFMKHDKLYLEYHDSKFKMDDIVEFKGEPYTVLRVAEEPEKYSSSYLYHIKGRLGLQNIANQSKLSYYNKEHFFKPGDLIKVTNNAGIYTVIDSYFDSVGSYMCDCIFVNGINSIRSFSASACTPIEDISDVTFGLHDKVDAKDRSFESAEVKRIFVFRNNFRLYFLGSEDNNTCGDTCYSGELLEENQDTPDDYDYDLEGNTGSFDDAAKGIYTIGDVENSPKNPTPHDFCLYLVHADRRHEAFYFSGLKEVLDFANILLLRLKKYHLRSDLYDIVRSIDGISEIYEIPIYIINLALKEHNLYIAVGRKV